MNKYEKRVAREVLAEMIAAYPKCFFPKDSPETVPLKSGIMTELLKAHPAIKRHRMGIFIGDYTGKSRYHRAVLTCSHRVGLDGLQTEPVKEEHRERASRILAEREAEKQKRAGDGDTRAEAASG